MKIEKFDQNNNINNIGTGNYIDIITATENQLPKGAILLDKNLLPSRGKFYDGDIYFRKLNVLDIKNLATLNETNVNNIINNVIKSCIVNKFDPNKILVGDKIWLIFYLRSITYNDMPFNVRGTCTECGTIANFNYVLKNLQVAYLDKDLPEYIVLNNGDKLTIKFPTLSTEAAITRLKNNDQVVGDINPELLELASYIWKVNDTEMSLYQVYKYICSMDAMDFSKYTNEMTNYVFSAKPYAIFNCPNCGEEVVLPMSFTSSFFLPKID